MLPIPELEIPWQTIVALKPTDKVRALVRDLMTFSADDPAVRLYVYCRLATALHLTA